jgi:hypothetical protein
VSHTKIQIPKGFIWKLADAAKSKIMCITSLGMNYDHLGTVVEFKGP